MRLPARFNEDDVIEALRISLMHEAGGLFGAVRFCHAPQALCSRQLKGYAKAVWTRASKERLVVHAERKEPPTSVDFYDEECLEAAQRLEERLACCRTSKQKRRAP